MKKLSLILLALLAITCEEEKNPEPIDSIEFKSTKAFSFENKGGDKTISFTYNMQTLDASVTYPKGTYDEWLDYAKTQYDSAVKLLEAGKTYRLVEALTGISKSTLIRGRRQIKCI